LSWKYEGETHEQLQKLKVDESEVEKQRQERLWHQMKRSAKLGAFLTEYFKDSQ
jgi:hypothetical protein